jgi:predicted TIM-barrel fold metal-dependent hydrolase
MPEVPGVLKNVYLTRLSLSLLPSIYTEVIRLAGSEKVLFGTDYPVMPPSRLFKEIDGLCLDSGDREALLGGNARRLLGI